MVTLHQLFLPRTRTSTASSFSSEDVRTLYESLWGRLRSGACETGLAVGLTACARGHGVTTVARNLALAAAETGDARVVVVDAHGPRTVATRHGGLSSRAGWGELLAGAAPLDAVAQALEGSPFSELPWGQVEVGELKFERLEECLSGIRRRFDLAVFDLPVADEVPPPLAAALDGVLLVVEASGVRGDELRRVKNWLEYRRARLLGAVLNKADV